MSNISTISCREQGTFWYDDDDDDVLFILDQHTEFYSASSMKQQSTGRHVLCLRHIILSQPVFVYR